MICFKKLIFLTLALSWVDHAFATADGPDFYRVRNVKANDVLNLRSQPSMKGKIVGRIPYNAQRLENLAEFHPPMNSKTDDQTTYWCKIKYLRVSGWAACLYLAEDTSEGPILHEGHYTEGHEVSSFKPCGSSKEYWLSSSSNAIAVATSKKFNHFP